MNTTDHYQLNQWEGTDRILRTDFNKDNLKTDDAVAELRETVDALAPKAGLQLIGTGTFGDNSATANLELPDIEWNQWHAVYIEIDVHASHDEFYSIKVNGYSSVYLNSVKANLSAPGTAGKRHKALLIFFPMYDENRCMIAMSFGTDEPATTTISEPFSNLSWFQISMGQSYTISPDSAYRIWGAS